MVIGNDLYQMLKSVFYSSQSILDNYYFKHEGEYTVHGLKNAYPVYSVISKYPNEDYYQVIQIDNKRFLQEKRQRAIIGIATRGKSDRE